MTQQLRTNFSRSFGVMTATQMVQWTILRVKPFNVQSKDRDLKNVNNQGPTTTPNKIKYKVYPQS